MDERVCPEDKKNTYDDNKKDEFIYTVCKVIGRTAAGLGAGVAAGIGAIAVAAMAEIAVPTILLLKAFGLTGGALGFLHGLKKN